MQMNSGLAINCTCYNNNSKKKKVFEPVFNKNENSIHSTEGYISPVNMHFLHRSSHLEA